MDVARIIAALDPPRRDGPVDAVLDTDAYNEIDDQFALVYALLARDALRCHAAYAAPFHNARSQGPSDGMRRSLEEIERVCDHLGVRPRDGAFAGSDRWLTDPDDSVVSPARDDLIERAMARDPSDPPLYVVAIGAATNVASAVVAEPAIIDRIVVVWIGSNPSTWSSAREFNIEQDPVAGALLFDSGVPLVQIPCATVADRLTTTHAEIHEALAGHGSIGEYLVGIFDDYAPRAVGRSKVIWDIATVAWLVDPHWMPSRLIPSPLIGRDLSIGSDPTRHPIREVVTLDRDRVFGDLFGRLRAVR